MSWLRLSRVNDQLEQVATSHLSQWELSAAQFDVIAHIGAAEGCLQIDVADRLLVTQGNVTQVLDRLEERGLIERRRDGRAKRLHLTEQGRQLFDEIVPRHEDMIDAHFSVLTPHEQQQLLRLLSKLDRAHR